MFKEFRPLLVMHRHTASFRLLKCVFLSALVFSSPGLLNSVRGAKCSRGRSAAHDHTYALSRKCPQGITGVPFYLESSINSLYSHLHG